MQVHMLSMYMWASLLYYDYWMHFSQMWHIRWMQKAQLAKIYQYFQIKV